MKANEKFLQALKYMDATMREDKKNKKPWRYTNVKKRYAKFEDARKHNRLTNCVSGVQMGFFKAGLPSETTHWYGAKGKIVYTTQKGRETVPKYFDIIKANDTPQGLYNKQKLCDGDILIYTNMNHTNCYYGDTKSFDSGHAYCTPSSGEMAVFNRWIGSMAHKSSKVSLILRLKDRAHYRVQCGAFSDIGKYNEVAALVEKKGFKTTKVVEDGLMKIQVGFFSGKTNAERLAEKVKKKGLDVIVKEIA